MLLHIDGSHHRWFQDERWYDLIVILDDATSEIYYAQLVEEESTVTVLAALRAVVERKRLFCALYSDRGSHFWLTPSVLQKPDILICYEQGMDGLKPFTTNGTKLHEGETFQALRVPSCP
jgi:hypothetical protein